MDFQIEVLDLRGGHVLEGEHHLARTARIIIAAVELIADVAADHQLADLGHRARRGHLFPVERPADLAVTQYGQHRALLQDLVHVMGDEDDCFAFFRHLMHDPVEDLASLKGQCGRRFIDDKDLRLVGHGSGDLHQLAILKPVFVYHVFPVDVLQAEFGQQRIGFAVHFALVHKAEAGEAIFLPSKQVLRHCAVGDRIGLLQDHGYPLRLCMHHAVRFPELSLEEHFPGSGCLHPRRNGCDRGFTAAVFSDQAVDFSPAHGQIHILQRNDGAEAFAHFFDFK